MNYAKDMSPDWVDWYVVDQFFGSYTGAVDNDIEIGSDLFETFKSFDYDDAIFWAKFFQQVWH